MHWTFARSCVAVLGLGLSGLAVVSAQQGGYPPADPPVQLPPLPPLPAMPAMPAGLPPVALPPAAAPALPPPVEAAPAPLPPAATPASYQAPATQPAPQQIEPSAEPTQDANNPTGRQEPAVSVEWLGPPAAKVGQAADYTVVVRNTSNIPVQQVMVRVRLSPGVQTLATEPKAVAEDNLLMWEIGNLLPKQEKNLSLRMLAPSKGDVSAQAWVTFTGSSTMRVRVREPKLLMKVTAPERVMVGDASTFVLTVSNPGDGAAEMVKLHADLSDGLEHARGNKVDFDIGNLNPGETRSVQVICGTRAGGEQSCVVTAAADGGLTVADKAAVSVITPRLDLEVKGPKLRYLDRKAVYTLKVTNPGDAPATNVTIYDAVPAGFKFLQADAGGRHDFSTRTVSWFLGEIGPGQSREVNVECLAVNTGEFGHKVLAQASRGLKVEGECVTRVEGLSAIMVEVVDLEDPVEVGGKTVYEVRITNTGSKTETDVKLVCQVPDKMQFETATGPTGFQQAGGEVVFAPLAKLAPRADAIYRVQVKATAPGVVNFKARITSAILVEPVNKDEATRIYAD